MIWSTCKIEGDAAVGSPKRKAREIWDLYLRVLGVGGEGGGNWAGIRGSGAEEGEEAGGDDEGEGGRVGGAGRRAEAEPVVQKDEHRGVVR